VKIYPAKKLRIPTIATTHSDGSRPVRRNDRHRRLLRARRERSRRSRASDERYERAAVHVWMAPAWQEKM